MKLHGKKVKAGAFVLFLTESKSKEILQMDCVSIILKI